MREKNPEIVFGLLGAFLENAKYISLQRYYENSQDEQTQYSHKSRSHNTDAKDLREQMLNGTWGPDQVKSWKHDVLKTGIHGKVLLWASNSAKY